MASRTSWQGSSNAELGHRDEGRAAVVADRPAPPPRPAGPGRCPSSSPRNAVVVTAKSRSPPSSWADDVRRISGQVGHGLSPTRVAGGSGMISSWWTARAPCRWAVPRQSAPVSPPPMMTTCLPAAEIGEVSSEPSCTRLEGFRYSMARWMPAQLPTGHPQVAGQGGAAGQHHGVVARHQLPGVDHRAVLRGRPGGVGVDGAHRDPAPEHHALVGQLLEPPVEHRLLHLELGDPVAEEPAGPLGPLEHHHLVTGPGQLLGGGQARRTRPHHRHPLAGGGDRLAPAPPTPPTRPAR